MMSEINFQLISSIFRNFFHSSVTDGRMDGRRDRASYRGAMAHLKTRNYCNERTADRLVLGGYVLLYLSLRLLVACYATLQPAMSVHWLIGQLDSWLVGRSPFYFSLIKKLKNAKKAKRGPTDQPTN